MRLERRHALQTQVRGVGFRASDDASDEFGARGDVIRGRRRLEIIFGARDVGAAFTARQARELVGVLVEALHRARFSRGRASADARRGVTRPDEHCRHVVVGARWPRRDDSTTRRFDG